MNLKSLAIDVFLASLKEVHLDGVMRQQVSREGTLITVQDQQFDLAEFDDFIVLAIGKASNVLLMTLLQILPELEQSKQTLRAVLVSPNRIEPDARVQQFEGDHPFPAETSSIAAHAILKLLASATEKSLVFFLISGGASSMVEAPLNPEWSALDVRTFYQGLVHSGLTISMMNALRKHASRVKGGRLALAASRATQCTLLVSDVPDGLAHLIGSGPSLPDPSTIADCRTILAKHAGTLQMPPRLMDWLVHGIYEETPKADNQAFRRSSWHVLLSNRNLIERAQALAESGGFFVEVDTSCDDWDYRDAASYLLGRLKELRKQHERVCLLSGGELSVRVDASHGRGGRNQQFALECARLLAGTSFAATVLSAGSDGVDGNSEAAGAVADETTFARAAAQDLNAFLALETFDTHSIFHALGDCIMTGPTGNNLRDLRMLLSSGKP